MQPSAQYRVFWTCTNGGSLVIVLTGVSGSGKTTVGRLLASQLNWEFADADEYHSPASVEKMRNGIPLTDADRAPWLQTLRNLITTWTASKKNAILACSALRQTYRQSLAVSPEVQFVYLKGTPELLQRRLRARVGHFMTARMLKSQLATLEEPVGVLTVDVDQSTESIAAEIRAKLHLTMSVEAGLIASPSAELAPSGTATPETSSETTEIETRVVRTLTWRLIPFLFLLYIVAYLDRINVGFAALQMRQQLAFTDSVYGLGAGMFFAGYFFFQVPSNLALQRVGARRWIALLMMVWGIISASMITVSGQRSFYLLRFLLGAAEAGFFPGVILYLKNWFPAQARARTLARFMTAGPLSGVVGGPLSGALLGLHLTKGLAGWQWMFLMEGIPAVLLGAVAWAYLVDRPEEARWLPGAERDWLVQTLQRERIGVTAVTGQFAALQSGRIWMLALVYFGLNTVSYGVSLWLPTLIRSVSGVSNLVIGLLSAIPYIAAAIAMVAVGIHSDRSGERRWHTAIPALAGALALTGAAFSTSAAPAILCISVAVLGVNCMLGPFWAMPTSLLSGTAAAAGIAFINSVGNLGGFVGPYAIGLVRTSTGQFKGGLLLVSAALAISGAISLMIKLKSREGFAAGN